MLLKGEDSNLVEVSSKHKRMELVAQDNRENQKVTPK